MVKIGFAHSSAYTAIGESKVTQPAGLTSLNCGTGTVLYSTAGVS